jgi:hemerythrin superfamily protein
MRRPMTDRREDENVIALLERQLAEIRTLFGVVEGATGDERRDAFYDLLRLLAVHETAEEEIVHPEVRDIEGGDVVVNARIGEEHRAKQLLSTLYDMGPDAEGFDILFVELKVDVLAHAAHEEREEFPLLRKAHDEAGRGRWLAPCAPPR